MEPSQPSQPSEPVVPVVPAAPGGPPAPVPGPAAHPGAGPYAAPGPYTSPGMPYAGPYGPYGRPPAPATSGLAVGSLVSGIVCCLPPLGLVLGIFALRRIRKGGQSGKGLAIAGIALSTVSTLLVVLGLATGQIQDAVRGFGEGVREAAASRSPMELRTGQCFLDDAEEGGYTLGVETVDCARPHDGEITGRFEVTGFDRWPGDDELERLGEARCEALGADYALDTWALGTGTLSLYYYPDRQSWREGERRVACGLGGEERTKGSLRSDRTTLTPDQLAFLTGANPIEDALYAEPEEDPEEELQSNRAWAADVRSAIDTARSGMRGRVWERPAQAPVKEYLASLDAASKRWAKLALAKDADAFWEEYDQAWELMPADDGAAVRKALGLTDTPPEAPGEHGSA
ncbi:DUF4190 domain-containing protein [Streptomyces omiyaensis]|uniref:DUF4190 domain-containing protein n=1 Tax=Streptomyces omiyaensis TaxID=68247 RepID=A0ABW7BXE9_9ACTN|nr:DUF4190 domain-containing protein [Streptomyces omiyaensis]GGY63746.1 hypothetical protein GCM10010363_51530 [Streptomyces omiyaensis]